VPDDFRFAVKLHRFGTHRKKLIDPDLWVPRSDADHPYHGAYGARRLRPSAGLVGELLSAGVDVHAYFNNDVDANAPLDAARFRDLVVDVVR
jgi:uncharacterized protein YecE (DUF72 family)